MCLTLLDLDEVLAANTCIFGRLALFALPGDRGNVRFNGTNPQSPPLCVFFIGRNSKEAHDSITAYDTTTTIRHFGNTKATDSKKMDVDDYNGWRAAESHFCPPRGRGPWNMTSRENYELLL